VGDDPGEWPADGSRPLGVHLEGPFLARTGAHRVSALRPPAPEEVGRLLAAFSPAIVTLAPGGAADLVVLDEGLVARLTLIGGRVAHAGPGLPGDLKGLEPPRRSL
jgi:N-acetylglucosamine-6-phosphate deacetylase